MSKEPLTQQQKDFPNPYLTLNSVHQRDEQYKLMNMLEDYNL